MKKNFLLALCALLALATNAQAQNNTYNMVIEMANGTKISLGPNDVSNISFNDGQLVLTGENITQLVDRLTDLETGLNRVQADQENLRDRIGILVSRDELNYIVDDYCAPIYSLVRQLEAEARDREYKIQGWAEIINSENGQPYTYRTYDRTTSSVVDKPWTMDQVVDRLESLENCPVMIDYLHMEIEELHQRISNLEDQVSSMR